MYQRFHGLIGRAAGLLDRILANKTQDFIGQLFVHLLEECGAHGFVKAVVARKAGPFAGLLLAAADDGFAHQFAIFLLEINLQGFG